MKEHGGGYWKESDYFLQRDHGGRIPSFDAKVIDRENMGRFVNQGGLAPALKHACQLYAVEARRQWSEIERCAQKHTNCEFVCKRNNTMYIQTTKEISLPSNSACEELLITYGIKEFWVRFCLKHPKLGVSKDLLWQIFSKHGYYDDKIVAEEYDISESIKLRFHDMPCPYDFDRCRSRR